MYIKAIGLWNKVYKTEWTIINCYEFSCNDKYDENSLSVDKDSIWGSLCLEPDNNAIVWKKKKKKKKILNRIT